MSPRGRHVPEHQLVQDLGLGTNARIHRLDGSSRRTRDVRHRDQRITVSDEWLAGSSQDVLPGHAGVLLTSWRAVGLGRFLSTARSVVSLTNGGAEARAESRSRLVPLGPAAPPSSSTEPDHSNHVEPLTGHVRMRPAVMLGATIES
jgi:hypothetical protein